MKQLRTFIDNFTVKLTELSEKSIESVEVSHCFRLTEKIIMKLNLTKEDRHLNNRNYKQAGLDMKSQAKPVRPSQQEKLDRLLTGGRTVQ